MNTFSSTSRTTVSETIIPRFVALLAIGVLSALPAVAGANSVPDPNHVDTQFAHAELFGGAVVRLLSTEEMSATQGQFSIDELDAWIVDAAQVIGEAAELHQETFVSSGEEPNHNNQAYTIMNGGKAILPHHFINISQGDPFLTDIVNVFFALTYGPRPGDAVSADFYLWQYDPQYDQEGTWIPCCNEDGEVPESLAHLDELPPLSQDEEQVIDVNNVELEVQPAETPSLLEGIPDYVIDAGHFDFDSEVPENQTPENQTPENETQDPDINGLGIILYVLDAIINGE